MTRSSSVRRATVAVTDVDGRVHRHGEAPHHGLLTDVVPAGRLNAPVVTMLRAGTGEEL